MRIKVTEIHIRLGKEGEPCLCPVALALRDAGFWRAEVGSNEVTYDGALIPLPDEAHDFICDFDTYKDVTPFEFDFPLEAPKC